MTDKLPVNPPDEVLKNFPSQLITPASFIAERLPLLKQSELPTLIIVEDAVLDLKILSSGLYQLDKEDNHLPPANVLVITSLAERQFLGTVQQRFTFLDLESYGKDLTKITKFLDDIKGLGSRAAYLSDQNLGNILDLDGATFTGIAQATNPDGVAILYSSNFNGIAPGSNGIVTKMGRLDIARELPEIVKTVKNNIKGGQ